MILQRLNMDTSWWLGLGATRLLVDPWLGGVEVDGFGWFNTQWHRTPPVAWAQMPGYDAVLITQRYADHCHEETLRRLQPARVIAPRPLKERLSRWLPEAAFSWLDESSPEVTLGDVTVTLLASRRRLGPIYDAFALSAGGERLVLANHGFVLDARHKTQLGTSKTCEVLLSPFNRYRLPGFLGGTVAPGLSGLQALIAQLNPRAVAQTHDEDKHARGLVPWLARREAFDPDSAAGIPWLRDRFVHISDYERRSL